MNYPIREAVNRRGIDYLLHFTRVENLPSIMQNGLLPRETLDNYQIGYCYNDSIRLDGTGAISLSIEFPNYKMFYRLRRNNPKFKWAVLLIRAEVLYELECAFCFDNAACIEVTRIPLEQRTGVIAFERMFDDWPDKPIRDEMALEDCYPTNPQAEVLVFSPIPPKYFSGVMFYDDDTLNTYRYTIPKPIMADVDLDAYRPRFDYALWR